MVKKLLKGSEDKKQKCAIYGFVPLFRYLLYPFIPCTSRNLLSVSLNIICWAVSKEYPLQIKINE